MKHTCEKDGRSNCALCMQFETGLWDAINHYASSVGGDPSEHVHDNERRMQAVADVGRLISQQRAAVGQLREVLAAVRDFLWGTSRRHTHTVVAIVDGVLNEVGSVNPRGPASLTNPNCTGTVGKDFLPCGANFHEGRCTMTDGSMPPPPPCALLVMCNECGSGTEMPLPIDREGLARFLILQGWHVGVLTPPGQVPILLGALCGGCAPKVFSPEALRAAEERRQRMLRGESGLPGTGG